MNWWKFLICEWLNIHDFDGYAEGPPMWRPLDKFDGDIVNSEASGIYVIPVRCKICGHREELYIGDAYG